MKRWWLLIGGAMLAAGCSTVMPVRVHLSPALSADRDRYVILEFQDQEAMITWLNALIADGKVEAAEIVPPTPVKE